LSLKFLKKWPRRPSSSERINHYVNEVLAAHLHLSPDVLLINPLPSKGRNTILRLLTIKEPLKTLLLRIYPYVAEKRKGVEHAHVSRLLHEHGINVPEIRFCDDSATTRAEFEFEAIVEDYVSGHEPDNADIVEARFINELASVLTKMHQIKSDVAGKPWHALNERQDPIRYYVKRSSLYLKRVSRHLTTVGAEALQRCKAFLQREVERLRPIREFSFVHGDVQTGNLIIAARGEIYVVDFGTCGYGYFEEDLVSAELGVFGSNETAFEMFVDSYFAIAGRDARNRYDQTRIFFLAFYHLEKASSAATRVRKMRERKTIKTSEPATFEQKALTNWQCLLRIVKSEL
jgi:aminoglycoside phosphotransferase (APT) family kinase protein